MLTQCSCWTHPSSTRQLSATKYAGLMSLLPKQKCVQILCPGLRWVSQLPQHLKGYGIPLSLSFQLMISLNSTEISTYVIYIHDKTMITADYGGKVMQDLWSYLWMQTLPLFQGSMVGPFFTDQLFGIQIGRDLPSWVWPLYIVLGSYGPILLLLLQKSITSTRLKWTFWT